MGKKLKKTAKYPLKTLYFGGKGIFEHLTNPRYGIVGHLLPFLP
jgi:hypothetical protein